MLIDGEKKARMRSDLLTRGQGVAQRLEELLAGKSPDLSVFPEVLKGDSKQKLEDRLRSYLALLEKKRLQLESDDDRFGRCKSCGDDLPLTALEEMPWAELCQSCASS